MFLASVKIVYICHAFLKPEYDLIVDNSNVVCGQNHLLNAVKCIYDKRIFHKGSCVGTAAGTGIIPF